MKRENRYIVIKVEDVHNYLETYEQNNLSDILTKINNCRERDGKPDRNCVVVQDNWHPEYEQVWGLIADRVDGKPNRINYLQSRLEEMEELVVRSKEVLDR